MNSSTFNDLLKKYACLIVETGVNAQAGQTIILHISVEQSDLAHLIVKEAYKKGVAEVIVQWTDETIQREFLLHGDESRLTNVPQYKVDQTDDWIKKGASRINVVSSNPDALAGVDTTRVAEYQRAMTTALRNMRQVVQANKISWTVVAAAGKDWAKKVFPDLKTSEEQVAALWDEIFKATQIFSADPVAAWQAHDEKLRLKAEELNHEQFDALHYTSPETDLIIGLPHDHVWEGAGSWNIRGEKFMANMPTEEIFTAPDNKRVDGYVSSTKPLSYAGTTIEGMHFTFKAGEVINATAKKGEDVLHKLLATDAGAKRLGEIALVPDPSPISQSGIIFYNTLFDENASNHLALGSAYAFNLKGGTEMTDEALEAAGLNRSQTHVDFMIGSDQMNIEGIRKDGSRVLIFQNGDWA